MPLSAGENPARTLKDNQMSGTAYWKKFGQSLNDSQKYGSRRV